MITEDANPETTQTTPGARRPDRRRPVRPLRSRDARSLLTHTFDKDKFEGPWFTTQLMLASFIGIMSFILFSVGRTRWPLLFAPRTKLKGASASMCQASKTLT
jgi:hypothetical protein